MAFQTTDPGAHRPVPTPSGPQRRPWSGRAVRTHLILIAVAWAVTVGAYLAGAAAVLPVLILAATAGLVRGGRSLLDRFMLALAILLGAVCVAGLLFSVWPWGLHPVPVAGTALTALILLSAFTGRRPQFPRPQLSDGLTLGAAVAAGAFAAFPLLRGDAVDRLGMAIAGEDLGRHVTLFDSIRSVGGYLFLHWDAAQALTFSGMITYPQGSHLLAGLLDGFVRSSPTELGTGLNALDHYLGFVVLGFALLALTLAWAAQWLAGPTLTVGRRILLIGAVTTFCLGGELFTLLVLGYPSEVLGLVEAVLLLAVLARPSAGTRPTLLTVACLLVAVGFTYYLFLPAALLAVGIWLVSRRRQVLPHWPWLAVVIGAGALAVVPAVIGLVAADQGEQLRVPAPPPTRDVLLALGCVALVGLIHPQARRIRVWRAYSWSVAAVAATAAGLYLVQLVLAGGDAGSGFYYTNKMLHLLLAALVVSLGALLFYLPPAPRREPTRTMLRSAVPAALLVIALAAGIGMVFRDSPYRTVGDTTWTRAWFTGKVSNGTVAAAVAQEFAQSTAPPGTVTVVINDDVVSSYLQTVFLSALQRTSGLLGPGMYIPEPITAPGRNQRMIANIDAPVLIVAQTDRALREALQIKDSLPDRAISIRGVDR